MGQLDSGIYLFRLLADAAAFVIGQTIDWGSFIFGEFWVSSNVL